MPATNLRQHAPYMVAVGALCNTTIFRVDHVPPLPAKALATDARLLVDGMSASAACAFVKLGGQAEMWARVGDDAHGQKIRVELAADGLNTDHLHTVPNSQSSQSVVIVDSAGDRLVTAFHDPKTDQSPAWLPLDRITRAGIVHCDVRWPDGAEAALKAAQAQGIPTMIDGDVAPRDILQRLIPLANFAVFSDAGLLTYSGCDQVEQGLLQVGESHPGHVGASCGPQGYFWYEEGTIRHVAAPVVDVVDTLSAGDIFHGAFALALLEGKDIASCARFACVAASIKCTRFGGRLACPSREEVDTHLETSY